MPRIPTAEEAREARPRPSLWQRHTVCKLRRRAKRAIKRARRLGWNGAVLKIHDLESDIRDNRDEVTNAVKQVASELHGKGYEIELTTIVVYYDYGPNPYQPHEYPALGINW